MKTTVYRNEFHDYFKQANRENQFSYDAREILFDYFEEYEQSTGEEIELDVVAICCEYSEMSKAEIQESYDIPEDQSVEEYLDYHTAVCGQYTEKGEKFFVFQQF